MELTASEMKLVLEKREGKKTIKTYAPWAIIFGVIGAVGIILFLIGSLTTDSPKWTYQSGNNIVTLSDSVSSGGVVTINGIVAENTQRPNRAILNTSFWMMLGSLVAESVIWLIWFYSAEIKARKLRDSLVKEIQGGS